MDPLSKLPIECLQHILQVITDWDHKRTATLAALLTTNKHIFAATLPYLYNDPFKTSVAFGYDQGPDGIHRQCFIRLLLGRSSINILPLIVSLEFEFNTTPVYPGTHVVMNPIMDYVTYIRHLHVEMPDTNPRPIVYEEFPGQYRQLGEVRLNSITPLMMKFLDPMLDHGSTKLSFTTRNFNNETVRERADGATQAMILFIKQHKRLFKNRLKIVHVNDVGMWGRSSYNCPPEVLLEITKLVPPLSQPRS
ncbi:hypothetical protein EDD11_010166 [Mortierella claussenii]|nr:hypothetical protein EDD11_010166 [Mortierella claussenii]